MPSLYVQNPQVPYSSSCKHRAQEKISIHSLKQNKNGTISLGGKKPYMFLIFLGFNLSIVFAFILGFNIRIFTCFIFGVIIVILSLKKRLAELGPQ